MMGHDRFSFSMRYLALLRGINVGGNNIIPMARLKASFEALGFSEVATVIQSGNVLFTAPSVSLKTLEKKIEAALSHDFGYEANVVLCSKPMMAAVVRDAPKGFGSKPDAYRYDVLFLKAPLTGKKAIADVPTKEGVDTVHAGKNVLYFSRLIAKITQTKLTKIVGTPVYKQMTIRNWNTTSKLAGMMEKG